MSAEIAGRHHTLMIIFEMLGRLGEGSESWKKENVSPVFKTRKKEHPGNYWTVRLTTIIGKMMEHLILGAVSLHMGEKKVIGSSHGFISGKLC